MDSNHGPSQKKPSDLCHYRQVWLWWRCAGCIALRLMVDENSGTRSLWDFSGPPPCLTDSLKWNRVLKGRKRSAFSDLSAVPMILATSVILLKCYSVCWGSLLGIVWTSHSGKVFFFATLALRLFHGSWRRSYSRCLFVESLLDLCFIFSPPPGF